MRAVIDTKIGQYLAAKIFTEINSKRYSYKNYRCNYRGFSTLEGSFFKYRSGISKPLQEKRRKFDAWAAYRRQKSYEHLSKRQYAFKVDAFASIFDTWFDTQYLTGPDVCLWTRSKDHEQPFSIFPFVIVDRLSYLIILRAAGCARKREGEKGSKSGAGFFFDEIMASELSAPFLSLIFFIPILIRSTYTFHEWNEICYSCCFFHEYGIWNTIWISNKKNLLFEEEVNSIKNESRIPELISHSIHFFTFDPLVSRYNRHPRGGRRKKQLLLSCLFIIRQTLVVRHLPKKKEDSKILHWKKRNKQKTWPVNNLSRRMIVLEE